MCEGSRCTGRGVFREPGGLAAALKSRAAGTRSFRVRVEPAGEAERRRIAREMHDTLAHRLSLLSVHAGALEFRPGATAAEIAQAAAVIRTSATAALNELREAITMLRDDAAGPPQPTLAQLPALLEESRAAGMVLQASIGLHDAESLPPALGRIVYPADLRRALDVLHESLISKVSLSRTRLTADTERPPRRPCASRTCDRPSHAPSAAAA